MEDGKFSLCVGVRGLACWLVVVCVAGALLGCRSSRSSSAESVREGHALVSDSARVGVAECASASAEESADTAELLSRGQNRVTFLRDSAGRIVEIRAQGVTRIKSSLRTSDLRRRWFYGLNATRCSEAAAEVDSVVEEKAETATDAQVGVPLMVRLGCLLVAVVIFFYVGDYIYRRWKERRR